MRGGAPRDGETEGRLRDILPPPHLHAEPVLEHQRRLHWGVEVEGRRLKFKCWSLEFGGQMSEVDRACQNAAT